MRSDFLLSLVPLAGMAVGVVFCAVADGLGSRRSMTLGHVLLEIASALGGPARGAAPLMLLRAVEGFGFLLVVLPAPGLARSLVDPRRVSAMMGVWRAYMPLAMTLALPFVGMHMPSQNRRGSARRSLCVDRCCADACDG
jgi:MFS transporter, CP family, cyanate transporter